MVNEKANVHVTLNSQEAQHQLEELQAEMKRLIQLKKKAEETGDLEGYKKIDKEIKKVNRSANKLVREHRDLEQTLKNLNGASIDELQTAQRTLTAQTKKLNRETKEYTDKKAQLKLVKKELGRINGEYRQQQSLVSRLTNGFNKYFAVITAGAASFAGVIIGIRKAVDLSNQFEETSDNLAALTGLGAEQIKYLEKQAEDTSHAIIEGGVRIKQSANDILDAYTLVGSQRPELLKNAEALHQVTQESIILSEAAKMQLEPAAAALANTLNQFNETSDQSRRIINILAAGSQAGAGNIEYLSKAVEKNGTTFNLMNVSIEESIAAIETVAPYYARAEMAGNSLDKVLLKMKANQIGYKDGVFDLNRAIDELRERYANGESAVSIFGVEHAKMAELLVLNQDELKRYTTLVSGSNKAIEQAATNTDNNNAKLAQARNERELTIKQLGQKLSPILTHVTSKTTLMFKVMIAMVELFAKYGRTIIATTAAVTAYWIAVKVAANWTKIHYAYLVTAQAVSKAYAFTVAVITGKIKLATVAQKAWNLAQKANPIGLVTGLVVGAGVALAAYIKKTRDAAGEQKELNTELERTEELLGAQLYQQFLEDIGLYKDEVITLADGSKQFVKVFDDSINVLNRFGEKVKTLGENDLQNFRNYFETEIVDLQRSLDNLDPESILYLTNESKIQEYSDALALVNKELAVFAEKRKKLNNDTPVIPISDEERKKLLQALDASYNEQQSLIRKKHLKGKSSEDQYNAELLKAELDYLASKLKIYKEGSKEYQETVNKALELEVAANKTINDLILKANQELEAAKISNLKDNNSRELKEEEYRWAKQKQNLEKQLIDKEQLSDKEIQYNAAINALIEQQEIDHQQKMADIKSGENITDLQNLVDAATPFDPNFSTPEEQQALYDARTALIEAQYEKEKELAGTNQALLLAAERKYKRDSFQVKSDQIDAEYQLMSSRISNAQSYVGMLAGVVDQESALGKALFLFNQGLAIGEVWVNIAKANAKAIAASPLTLGQPWVTANTVQGGIQTALIAAQTVAKFIAPKKNYAEGKYPNLHYMNSLQTGMYGDQPHMAIFNEVPGEPEMVIDGRTNRTLHMNYPEVIKAIYAVRDGHKPRTYAEGKYDPPVASAANLTQPYTDPEIKELLQQNTRVMKKLMEWNIPITDVEKKLKKLSQREKLKGM